jgi:hypothetical protein
LSPARLSARWNAISERVQARPRRAAPHPSAERSRWSRSTIGIFLVVVLAFVLACGRKTDVKPPELVAPEVVQNVTARNVADAIRVRWARPRNYADGTTMRDLAGFRVERARGDCAFEAIATIPVVDRDRFQQKRRFEHLDSDVEVGARYSYRVMAITEYGHTSPGSAIVELVRAIPPPEASEEKKAQ